MGLKLSNDALERLSPADFKTAEKQDIVLVLDNIRSLHNVGSVFRSSDAFRIKALYLCGLTGTPPHKEIEKTALGATLTVTWRQFSTTLAAIDSLKQDGYAVYAIEQVEGSTLLQHFKKREGKIALVFGNEVYGVEQEVIDQCAGAIEIPQYGTKHSLNIAVSAGIVLWELAGR